MPRIFPSLTIHSMSCHIRLRSSHNDGFTNIIERPTQTSNCLHVDFRKLTIMKKSALIGICLILTSCQTAPSLTYDKHTGDTIAKSQNMEAAGGLLNNLNVQALHSKKVGYGLNTYYTSTGLGWLFIEEAWSFGKPYKYIMYNRDTLGCNSGCTISETGFIPLTKTQFESASKNGFEFKLIGKNGSIEGKAPATAFQQVLKLQK